MKLILVEAPKAGVLWVAEENGNLGDAERRAVYGDHRKIMTVTKDEFNGSMSVKTHPTVVTSLRVWLQLIAPAETNWSAARDALAQVPDTGVLAAGLGYNLTELLEGNI